MWRLSLLSVALLAGCPDKEPVDLDGDGIAAEEDCDDSDPTVGGTVDRYPDGDGDGFGAIDASSEAICPGESGYAESADDCDDANAAINPAGTEVCEGGAVDEDCDGLINTDDPDLDSQVEAYVDEDGDGYGGATQPICPGEPVETEVGGDCDDGHALTHPGAMDYVDGIDNDCDGEVDLTLLSGLPDRWAGEHPGDQAGASVASVGDVDGDGIPDILVGVPGEDSGGTDSGAVVVATPTLTPDGVAASVLTRLVGELGGDQSGSSVSSADLNNDGIVDLIIGAPGADQAGIDRGAVTVVFSPVSGVVDLASADVHLFGLNNDDFTGSQVVGLTDGTGDGVADLLIGAWGSNESFIDVGTVYLLEGPLDSGSRTLDTVDTEFVGENSDDYAGFSVASVGDRNGDGINEVFIGVPGYDGVGTFDVGAAYLFHGPPPTGEVSLVSATARLKGQYAYDDAGRSVADAGDVNGDGNSDLIIGAPQADLGGPQAGEAYLITAAVVGDFDLTGANGRIAGMTGGDRLGTSVAGAGDVNGDGFGDLLVGAPEVEEDNAVRGAVYLVLGPLNGTFDVDNAHARLIGSVEGDRVGGAIASAGDINADGYADFIVGGPLHDEAGEDAGLMALQLGGPNL